MGNHLNEATVLRAAHAFEQDLGQTFRPPLVEETAA
jgi:Asp-tRNA(Asn)/Glu-tRNA(Gln) amidotransferase A subunit family amidase